MKKLLSFVAVGLLAAALSFSCFAIDREHTLKVYNWADYIDEDLITEFEQWYEEQTGEPVKIIYQLFDINEVMLSKIEKGKEDFDVVCPSEYIIERMLRSDLLLPIERDFGSTPDYTQGVSPFMRSLLSQVQASGKDANLYTVPYMWGTVGLMYNTKHVSREEASSWDVLKDRKFKGMIFMKEAFRDVYTSLNIALHKDAVDRGETSVEELSYDTSEESVAAVEAYLNEVKGNVAGWEADFGKEMMTKEKGWINLTWSGDAQWAMDEASAVGVSLDYVIPSEGSIVWFDGWVIPKYAKNVKAARYFINYMCMQENALRNMDVIGYVSAIGGDKILSSQSDSTLYAAHDVSYFFGEGAEAACVNPIQYPDAEIMSRCGMMHDKGTEELLSMWSRVKGDNAGTLTFVIIGGVVLLLAVALVLSRRKKSHRHKPAAKSSKH